MNASSPISSDGRSRILAASLEVFASVGFEGASLRRIAERAGVMHQLVVYHFKNKDGLWRETIRDILGDEPVRRTHHSEDTPAQALRRWWRAFARFTARHPQFHRILTLEAQADSPRFQWLLETYIRPDFIQSVALIEAAQAEGSARPGDPAELHYAVIGLLSTSLVFALEYRALTGAEPYEESRLARMEALAFDLLGLPAETA